MAPLVVLSGLCLLSVFFLDVTVYDEGLVLAGAERILSGELPYRDFWSLYPPGQFFTLAGLFALFEPTLLTARAYDFAVKIALLVTAFLFVRRISGSSIVGWCSWLFTMLWISNYGSMLYPIYPAIWLALLAGYLLAHYLENRQLSWLFSATTCLLIASLFRVDIGLPALLAEVLVLFLYFKNQQMDFQVLWRLLLFIAGASLLLLLLMWPMASPLALYQQLIVAPSWLIPEYRWLPYPFEYERGMPFFIVLPVVFVGYLIFVGVMWFRQSPKRFIYLWLLLVSGVGINQASGRSDVIHLEVLALFLLPLLPLMLTGLTDSLKVPARWGINAVGLMIAVYLFWPHLETQWRYTSHLVSQPLPAVELEKASHVALGQKIGAVVAAIKERTQPGEKIFVGVNNHDRLIFNDPVLYFLSDRGYGSYYHELHPGVVTTAEVQREIIQALQKNQVRLIVLSFRDSLEPNASSRDSGVDLLDNYIRSQYRQVDRFMDYEVWWKR